MSVRKRGVLEVQTVADSVGGCECGFDLFAVGVGRNNGTSRVCDRPRAHLLECAPTILAKVEVVGQWQERCIQGSVGRQGDRGFQWQHKMRHGLKMVAGSQVVRVGFG